MTTLKKAGKTDSQPERAAKAQCQGDGQKATHTAAAAHAQQ